ncbi:MAG: carbon-nitrogen family hydrolase [Opitutaceae bacterium]|nr:carbon-nitrogen family hydrolase [Opitutaceae bacterium]
MNVAGLQYAIAWEDRATNVSTARRLMSAADVAPGSLLVLPEMGLTGFSMDVARVADTEARESETALRALARDTGSWVVGGLVSRAPDGRGRNEALVASPDGAVAGRYSKMHPFTYTGEEKHYAPGDGPLVLPCGPFQLAPFVCYDLRFPEIFRTAARRGATLFVVIACWLETRHAHWRPLLQARAIENQAWVVGVNRCGRDPKFNYPGGSVVFAPDGRTVAELGADEGVLRATLDAATVAATREPFPVLRDLRPDWTRP